MSEGGLNQEFIPPDDFPSSKPHQQLKLVRKEKRDEKLQQSLVQAYNGINGQSLPNEDPENSTSIDHQANPEMDVVRTFYES